ncbi:MAG: hypothetical protein COT18_12520 [Elusimicrobia bacterium CG08_land_8_20_14_0_20_59_10]|nr:MAG: hypothetical protein COT18_12520 [Elusimicrobia bacterium CG08_land_8_20_14_0_20_59_10]
MKCPNCGLVAPDGTEVCEKCQIVFSKLEESLVKKALQAHATRIKEPPKDLVPPLYRVAFLFFITAALWFFMQAEAKRSKSAAVQPVVQADPAAPAAPVVQAEKVPVRSDSPSVDPESVGVRLDPPVQGENP